MLVRALRRAFLDTEEVGGSNPPAPTSKSPGQRTFLRVGRRWQCPVGPPGQHLLAAIERRRLRDALVSCRGAMTFLPAADRYDSMQYRRTGRSGLQLPAISLGLWQNFGGDRPFEEQRPIIHRAFDLGVTHFDLANNYGPPYGSAEENFGRVLAGDLRRYRDELVISTKAGYDMWPGPYGEWGSRKYLLASLDQSLARMGLDYVDIFYSHRADPDTPLEETLGALAAAVEQGKALVGISSYSPERTQDAVRILQCLGTPLLIHQPSYSMLNRWIEDGLLDVLGREGVGCIVFSPLAQGLLTDRYLHGSRRVHGRAGTARSPEACSPGEPREGSLAERDRATAGTDACGDGARVDAARPSGDLDARRREQRGPTRGQHRGAREPGLVRRGTRRDRPVCHGEWRGSVGGIEGHLTGLHSS